MQLNVTDVSIQTNNKRCHEKLLICNIRGLAPPTCKRACTGIYSHETLT